MVSPLDVHLASYDVCDYLPGYRIDGTILTVRTRQIVGWVSLTNTNIWASFGLRWFFPGPSSGPRLLLLCRL